MDSKFDWNDITIVPEILSIISSRSEIDIFRDGKLPLFTAPMDTVIDANNITEFEKNNINICLPRNVKYDDLKNNDYFYSYGLDEIIELFENGSKLPKRVLIDIANGHLFKLWNISKKIKEKFGDDIELMVGNIANPDTYRKYCEIGVDYIRVGIGGGSACTTSANVAVHYPMASLISECYEISKEFDNPTKIIADGGFKNYSDILKALALGASYVMVGGMFNKALESCSKTFIKSTSDVYKEVDNALELYVEGVTLYKYYRGMSTKEVQRDWNRAELKTGEGISKYNLVEYTLHGWCENFSDYLKSVMSYTNSLTLLEYTGETKYVKISQSAFNRFNK
jgi:GMP reductase